MFLTLTNTQRAAFCGVIADLAVPWPKAGVARLCQHLKGKHTRKNAEGEAWVPTQESLMGKGDWTKLLSLYGEAQSCDRCAAKPGAKRAVAEAPPDLRFAGEPLPNGFKALSDSFFASRGRAHG